MEFAMTEKIVRSVTAHSVVTSDVTKNAVNPRNSFIDQDKPTLADPAIEMDASETKDKTLVAFLESQPIETGPAPSYPSIVEHFDTRSGFVEAKKHIQDNRQKLTLEKPTDNDKFVESLHRIEERISTLREKHPKDNHQSTGPLPHFSDNIQPLDKVSYKDNILFREKKNIGANIQSVRDGLSRDAPNLPTDASLPDVDRTLATLDAAQTTDALSDEINLDDAQLLLNGELGAFDEDELRARVRKMQEKLTRVNQTLKDIENNKEST
jgi:hypothetical protein